MIYEYPEEFIVPIVYVEDFKDNYMYRCKTCKCSQDDKLLIPDKELKGDGIFLAEVDIQGAFKYEDINFLNIDGEVLQESHNKYILKESKAQDNSECENIISYIDEEYANSET